MNLIQKTHNYSEAFYSYLLNRSYNLADLGEGSSMPPSGFALPEKAAKACKDEMQKSNVLRQYATIVRTDTQSRIKALMHNATAAFVPEDGEIPIFEGSVDSYNVHYNKIASFGKVSNELLRDNGFDLQAAMFLDMAREIADTEEKGCILADGSTAPWGLLHPDFGAEVGVTTTGTTPTFNFGDIQKLYFSLPARFRRHAIWVMSDETCLHVRQLKDAVGASVWRDFDSTIFGRPVITTPHMPSISAGEKPVIFGDLRYFWIIERGDLRLQALHELFANEGATGFIATHFVDARLIRREAVKALQIAE